MKIVTSNRKAYHEYHILDTYEAGIQLMGSEVKSIREGNASLKESYILIRKGEAWLKGAHIASYSHTGIEGHELVRDRKLLLHKKEISRIGSKLAEKGLTAIPTKLYFKGGLIKIELGLAKGKKLHDKRDTKKKRDVQRDIQRALSQK
ncbi:MAG: SsrA-binding protein SmpB [Candidatus Marinimicrobia bacterium]|nr:SsrA-binding protein SmpB [Candidatus Neomarinimicrobiota bacterium]MBT3502011.1 SsrA-binding protein SmpB [Candidatus Neomarinimicrobiota bacterium]MBT3838479.1 SsrA-binding protein SmpB [Candidatus Neomarinimicrobiota bacterium]MBT3999508.1 SsrA-binding protein SmpB [Candidatus Neomarinimicrobiota bacterium]MBT4281780.1 SsrA-binding protein SmpB [Candidatus Neomarinimicrobiota bacterium]